MAGPKRPKRLELAEEQQRPDAFDGEHLLIAEAPCEECLFSKGKLVNERRKRAILRECYTNGTYFICHKATLAGRAVICHNFAKSTDGAGNQALRVAEFFGIIRYVDPASGRPTVAPRSRRR